MLSPPPRKKNLPPSGQIPECEYAPEDIIIFRQFPKVDTCACRGELREKERLVYILVLGLIKTLSGLSAAVRTG